MWKEDDEPPAAHAARSSVHALLPKSVVQGNSRTYRRQHQHVTWQDEVRHHQPAAYVQEAQHSIAARLTAAGITRNGTCPEVVYDFMLHVPFLVYAYRLFSSCITCSGVADLNM